MSKPIGNTEQLAEPVAFVDKIWIERPDLVMSQQLDIGRLFMRSGKEIKNYIPLYTHQQKELSRKDFLEIWENEVNKFHDVEEYDIANFARAIIKASRGEK